MRLKRLELQGFKSFAGKTTLDFPSSGVVAIVGPNGSGKSNVIDAIRWILGERESKNLRGGKSDDLIFSGTDTKSRIGLAQASLHFDGSAGDSPVGEFAEVSVSRKIFRDGTSQYFLNKAEVRLKDLIDFFAGAKLGARGLTIINQGNSDLFVRATPAERREMIEEILGLRQFQLKRHEAELKLASTKTNLEKVRAMTDELLPRLKLLRRQAAKWHEHGQLAAELKNLENVYFALKYKNLNSEEAGFAPELASLQKNIAKKRGEFQIFQADLAKIQNEKPRIGGGDGERREREILSRRASLERELGRLEAKLEFLGAETKVNLKETELVSALRHTREELSHALEEENLESLREMLAHLVEKIDEIFEGKKADVSGLKKEIEETREQFKMELGALDGELENIRIEKTAATGALEAFNARFRAAFEAFESKKDELSELERAESRLRFDLERVTARRHDLEEEIRQIGRDAHDFKAVATPANLPADFAQSAERRMLRLRGELASIGEIDQATLKEAEETETRYQFLASQTADLEHASADLHTLISDLREKVKVEFASSLAGINEHFNNYFRLCFGGGKAKLVAIKQKSPTEDIFEGGPTEEDGVKTVSSDDIAGLGIDLRLPKKGIKGLEVLSGGEKSLVSIATLFALVSVSAPPFLVLDEVDAALDEANTRRFANLIKEFSKQTQFIIVTHNRATMEAADILYGITMGGDGVSKLLSVKLT
jgi:chromosome segregation protein